MAHVTGHYRVCSAGPEGAAVLAGFLPDPDACLVSAAPLPGRGGKCSSYRFALDGRSYFVKSYPAATAVERVKNLLRGSRAMRSWRLSRQFARLGIPVPRSVAMVQEGRWWPGRSWLVTDFVADARTFRQAWQGAGEEGRAVLLDRAATLLGKMHAAGVVHGDSHWDNLLVGVADGGERLLLIDFYSGKVSSRLTLAKMEQDLAHFIRDLFVNSGRYVEDKCAFLDRWWSCLSTGIKAHRSTPGEVPLSLSSKRKTRMTDKIKAQFDEHIKVARQASEQLAPAITGCIEMLASALLAGNKVLVFGNGGSAADAQHLAAELVGRFLLERKALPAIALTTDTSILTAVGNDYGFADVFSRQVQALARAGDVAIGISTSGNSENVLRGLEEAKRIGCRTIGLSGHDGGKMTAAVDIALLVPSEETPRIQESHAIIIHVICDNLEKALFGKQA